LEPRRTLSCRVDVTVHELYRWVVGALDSAPDEVRLLAVSVPKSDFRTSKPTLQDIDFDLNLGHASALDIQLPPILVNVLAQFIDEIAHAAIRPPLSMKCARQLVNR